MFLRWLLWRATYCVSLGHVVIRSTVGARRIPTQLLESLLALSLGLLVLVAVLSHGPANGALFVAVLAAYTLGRQGILHLRAEPRKTRLVTAILATLVLIADLLLLAK